MNWSYGITTVPQRKDGLLLKTLSSLQLAGFAEPRLFIDGADTRLYWVGEHLVHLQTSTRYPTIGPVTNWILSIWELYLRDPYAHRYAIFQDDLVCYKNLRFYLEQCPFPSKGYLNLYTWPMNWRLSPQERIDQKKDARQGVWYKSNQWGKGAVALVFDNDGVRQLLSSPIIVEKVRYNKDKLTGERLQGLMDKSIRNIDGMVITVMRSDPIFYEEYVHDPSLVQHTGIESTMGSQFNQIAPNFRGENFDAMNLI